MDDTTFWNLIEQTRRALPETDDVPAALTAILSECTADEIAAFARRLDHQLVALYRWDLWGIAYLVNGGCSDDGFEYFRRWVVAQGRDFYQRFTADPDGVFSDPELADACECEELTYAVEKAYEQVAGRAMPPSGVRLPAEPLGEPWDEDDLKKLFPKTAAVYS